MYEGWPICRHNTFINRSFPLPHAIVAQKGFLADLSEDSPGHLAVARIVPAIDFSIRSGVPNVTSSRSWTVVPYHPVWNRARFQRTVKSLDAVVWANPNGIGTIMSV